MNDPLFKTIIRSRLLLSLMNNDNFSVEEISERTSTNNLNIKLPCRVVIFRNDYSLTDNSRKDSLIEEFQHYVEYLLKKEKISNYCVTDKDFQLYALILETNNINNIDKLFEDIRERILFHFSLTTYIGIGSEIYMINNIFLSTYDAINALSYRYQFENSGVINSDNYSRYVYRSRVYENSQYKEIINSFLKGDLAEMETLLNNVIEDIRHTPNVSKTSIKRAMIELTVQVLNIASNNNVDTTYILKSRDPYTWILNQGHTEIITEWFIKICSEILLEMNKTNSIIEKQTIISAKEYIDANLNDGKLGLQSVCEYVGLTNSYFSQLFKKETGQGVNNYIVEKRVKESQRLLEETDYQIKFIASNCGFNSLAYFSQIFKSKTGYTPNKYRQIRKKLKKQ